MNIKADNVFALSATVGSNLQHEGNNVPSLTRECVGSEGTLCVFLIATTSL